MAYGAADQLIARAAAENFHAIAARIRALDLDGRQRRSPVAPHQDLVKGHGPITKVQQG